MPNKQGDVFRVIHTYKKIKGFDNIKNWDNVYRKRFLKPAGNMLQLADISVVIYYLLNICTKWNPNWNLWTAEKYFADNLIKLKDVINIDEQTITDIVKEIKENGDPH